MKNTMSALVIIFIAFTGTAKASELSCVKQWGDHPLDQISVSVKTDDAGRISNPSRRDKYGYAYFFGQGLPPYTHTVLRVEKEDTLLREATYLCSKN